MSLELLFSSFLPSGLLNQFEITDLKELGDVSKKQMSFYIFLEEFNVLPSGYNPSDYESKGFFEPTQIQDFPIRGKAVFLIIKRRRWRSKLNPRETISSDCSFIAQSAKLTEELSVFLKGTSG
jgi:hypothetical protein